MGNPNNRSRTSKRRKVFCGKKKISETPPPENLRSQKIKKRKSLDESTVGGRNDSADDNYNFIINFGILKSFVSDFLSCPECYSRNVELFDELSLRMGYAHKLRFICQDCPNKIETFTSPECEKTDSKQGRHKLEVNVRAVTAFREVGKGHESMVNVSRCLNMFSIRDTTYSALNDSLYQAYLEAANSSMQLAVSEIKATATDQSQPVKCRVSFDGTWQKRGFSSSNGIVTAMNSGRCIDVHVMSKICKKCTVWQERKTDPEFDYDQWKEEHYASDECEINHTKSSGAMEAAGAVEIFSRSVGKNGLIYSEYLGDGDTSSFSEVVASEPYKDHGNIVPEKLECVGHVQKRLGTRLRNLVKQYKGTATPLSGKGKLTEKSINSMQNYYGMAIRENKDKLYTMKKATGAILWHCTDFEDSEFRHRFCPKEEDSWCKYQQNSDYKPSINLAKWIYDLLLPVFKSLSEDELLRKCLHGETQNSNEAINNVIWTKCPKSVYVGRSVLEMGTNSAVLEFNEGSFGVSSVFKHFGISNGYAFYLLSEKRDEERVAKSTQKTDEEGKQKRKTIRAVKKGYIDKEKDKDSYMPGGF
jgi:hypothetical protein